MSEALHFHHLFLCPVVDPVLSPPTPTPWIMTSKRLHLSWPLQPPASAVRSDNSPPITPRPPPAPVSHWVCPWMLQMRLTDEILCREQSSDDNDEEWHGWYTQPGQTCLNIWQPAPVCCNTKALSCATRTQGVNIILSNFTPTWRDNLSGLQGEDSLADAVATAPLLHCTQDMTMQEISKIAIK